MPHHIKILQHNVRCWKTNATELCNIYQNIDPDIILLNSTGAKNENTIRIPGYITQQHNMQGESSDGTAIAVKKDLKVNFKTPTQQGLHMIEVDMQHEKVCSNPLPTT